LPLFVASIGEGVGTFVMSLGAFAVGVLLALVSAVLLVRKGLMKLDHPLFEHYGDVLTGLGVVLVGVLLLVLPHGHG
jgi:cytochrome c biogenesis protein CcdA